MRWWTGVLAGWWGGGRRRIQTSRGMNTCCTPVCALPLAHAGGAVAWSGGNGAPRPRYPQMRYDHLRTPSSGRCADPVNYASWQLLFTMLCPHAHP